MKILSWNVNGLRAVCKKGFLKWLAESGADIVCLQEIKAHQRQLLPDVISPKNYYAFFNPAARPGYAGTAVYTKHKPLKVRRQIGVTRFDKEGRVLIMEYPDFTPHLERVSSKQQSNLVSPGEQGAGFTLINLYLPHGGRQREFLGYKLEVYHYFIDYLKQFKSTKTILIGDFNIAHHEIDLARPKQNKNNAMFTIEERKQIDKITELGFVDSFRKFHQEGEHYTWWPYFANARERNLGWRIDYAFISQDLVPILKDSFILYGIKGSDHCPVGVEVSY